jgi:glycosyltransferase involved in cell wall biosynthesis
MSTKICILPEHRGVGGPASFRTRMIAGLADLGIESNSDPATSGVSAILVIGGTRRLDLLRQARRRGTRIVQRLNGMNWVHRKTHTGLRHYLRSEINNWILGTIRKNLADQIVFQSAFTEGWWNDVRGRESCPTEVIHNGVDLNTFSPSPIILIPGDHVRVLVVEGRFGGGYEVGLENAVRFSEVLREIIHKPVELVLAGDPGRGLTEKYSALDWITWKGIIPRPELPDLYRSAHLLFSADINASCPNAVIEALACGLPVVGYDTGALREILKGEGGLVGPYGASPLELQPALPLPLAESSVQILENRERFSRQARRRAETAFGLDMMIKKYLQVLLPEQGYSNN